MTVSGLIDENEAFSSLTLDDPTPEFDLISYCMEPGSADEIDLPLTLMSEDFTAAPQQQPQDEEDPPMPAEQMALPQYLCTEQDENGESPCDKRFRQINSKVDMSSCLAT